MSALFFVLLALSLSPWASPPAALAAGILFGLFGRHPYPAQAKAWTTRLLQASVVGLGFKMNLHQVLAAGASGLVYTAGGIAATMLAGAWLGRRLGVPRTTGYLISTGTAICGGSAIAAVGPILRADHDEMSVSLGTVFMLNAAALLLFPPIGDALGLTQEQFGLWAALAIHDTSSVVGAAARYGAGALAVATAVKLARALWIVPLSFATAALHKTESKAKLPWFILAFAGAAALHTYAPAGAPLYGPLGLAARAGLTATLFLIGAGFTRAAARKVGTRPLLLGVLLWLLAGGLSLALILAGAVR